MPELQNLSILKNSQRVRSILELHKKELSDTLIHIDKVDVSVLQSYQDKRSYNVTLHYAVFGKTTHEVITQDLVATSSWPVSNEYGYYAGSTISNALKNKDLSVKIPAYYTYIPEYNLILREYIPGARLSNDILSNHTLKPNYIDSLMSWLSEFQKIKLFTKIEKMIDLNDLESNLEILKKRKAPDAILLTSEYAKIKKSIQTWSRKYNNTLAHGDFNPANILIHKNTPIVIDFEGAHRGDRITDLANLIAYVSILLKKVNVSDKKIFDIENSIVLSYEKKTKNLSADERIRLPVYKAYFTLLFKAYELVWS